MTEEKLKNLDLFTFIWKDLEGAFLKLISIRSELISKNSFVESVVHLHLMPAGKNLAEYSRSRVVVGLALAYQLLKTLLEATVFSVLLAAELAHLL